MQTGSGAGVRGYNEPQISLFMQESKELMQIAANIDYLGEHKFSLYFLFLAITCKNSYRYTLHVSRRFLYEEGRAFETR